MSGRDTEQAATALAACARKRGGKKMMRRQGGCREVKMRQGALTAMYLLTWSWRTLRLSLPTRRWV